MTAYKPHVESVQSTGELLVSGGHYATDTIQGCLVGIGEMWNELNRELLHKGDLYILCIYISIDLYSIYVHICTYMHIYLFYKPLQRKMLMYTYVSFLCINVWYMYIIFVC